MSIALENRYVLSNDGWAHIASPGEHLHKRTGLIQVVDDLSVSEMVRNFTTPVLVDLDHESHDPTKSTKATAWVEELANRIGHLWGRLRPTETGAPAITSGEFRYCSAHWDAEDLGGGKVRPVKLLDVGLTNKPQLKNLIPISNREHGAPEEEANDRKTPVATKENHTMKLVNRALDLSPDASEDAAVKGIDTLKVSAATTLQNLANRETEIAAAKVELANRDGEITRLKAVIQENENARVASLLDGAKITEAEPRQHWTTILLANREVGEALLKDHVAAQKKLEEATSAARKPLTNREEARTPDDVKKDEKTGLARTAAAFAADKKGDQ